MTKTDLVKAMRRHTRDADFITREEVRACMGYGDPHKVDRYLHGLGKIGRKYYIPEVADRIMQEIK